MEAFEYLSVLISIVLGLGITQLMLGFARWLEQRDEVAAYGPAVAWAGFLLLVHIQSWWSMFGMQHHTDWTFLQFAIVLLQPMVLFLAASIVFPGATAPHQDMRDNFLHQRRWIYGLLIALLVISLLKDVVLNGNLPEPLNLGFHVVWLVGSAVGVWREEERVQQVLSYSALAMFMVYIVVLFTDL